jgi:hypothetical protein
MRQRNNVCYDLIKEVVLAHNGLDYCCDIDFTYNTGTSAVNSLDPNFYDPGENHYIETINNIEIIEVIDSDTGEKVLNYPPLGELNDYDLENILESIISCDLEMDFDDY